MTFYWWSHWFWITLLCNFIFPSIVVVYTYPSHDSTQEYNQNQNANVNKLVTKLYQTSTTLTWATEIPNLTTSTSTEGTLKLQSVTSDETTNAAENPVIEDLPILNNKDDEEEYYYDDEPEDQTKKINLEQVETELKTDSDTENENKSSKNQEDKDANFKRSAEIFNNTTKDPKSDLELIGSLSSATINVEKNNYTNFTSTNSSTTTNLNSTITTTTTTNISNSDMITTTNATTQMPQAPSTPNIVKAAQASSSLDWLNTVAGQLPTAHLTTDITKDYPDADEHKIPFTLENVNKRDEVEHRSRKSKGLSAEYKVNRYINYSSESKNLLTRSAATTVNEYDSEESNISSEALSVQRAYFMDVGAISAICFTVFGIFCTVGTIGIVLYRRRFLNKPQALSEPDSSVYIDDSTMRVSDNSDEMYSLDNDSFLNSLEAMTIQNYWTDTVKHTKL